MRGEGFMKQAGRVLAFVLMLTCLVTPAFGLVSSGDLAGELDSRRTEQGDGSYVSAWSTLASRFTQLEKTFGTEVSLGVWSTPEAGGCTSLEDMRTQAAAFASGHEDRITLVYTTEGSFVHVGSGVKPGCDLSAVEGALANPGFGDFDRLMGAWRALWTLLADDEPIYPTRVTSVGGVMDEIRVEAALAPLYEVFTGPVTVYCGTGENMERMAADVDRVRNPYEGDGLLLCYEETTGAVGIHVGAATGLKLTGTDKVAAAFAAGGAEGFAQGVEALAQHLKPLDSRGPWTIPLTAGTVALIALGEIWWKRRKPKD